MKKKILIKKGLSVKLRSSRCSFEKQKNGLKEEEKWGTVRLGYG